MNLITDFFSEKILPWLTRISESSWIRGMHQSKMKMLPMIFVGTVISVYSVVQGYVPQLPNLSPIKDFTYGLISLFMVYMIPYNILQARGLDRNKHTAGCTGISIYMILANPSISTSGYLYNFTHFGPDGMLVAVIAGVFTTLMFMYFNSHTMQLRIKELVPTFVDAIDAILPVTISVIVAYVLVYRLNLDVYSMVLGLIEPLKFVAQRPVGFVLLSFLPVVFYSMGIGSWILQPIIEPIVTTAILLNISTGAENVFTNETLIAFINLGGKGATLGLVFLMIRSHSKRLKTLGIASAVPSLMNIGDPVAFGVVIWNPIMMIPMWLNGIILPMITYFFITFDLIPAPHIAFNLWYVPIGFSAFYTTRSFWAIFLVILNLGVSTLIWYPFFRSMEKKMIEREYNILTGLEKEAEEA